MGAAMFDRSSLNLSAPRTPIGRIAAQGNDLCTRLVGTAKQVRGEGERARVAAGLWKRLFLWRVDHSGVGSSCPRLPGPGRVLGVFCFKVGGGVREEEHVQNTDWNVNWSISDAKSRVISYSSFFICSAGLTSFLNSQL